MKLDGRTVYYTVIREGTYFVVKHIHPVSGDECTSDLTFGDAGEASQEFKKNVASGKAQYLDKRQFEQMVKRIEQEKLQLQSWNIASRICP